MDKNFAKVRLSAEEMRLVMDPAWILTKNSVMGKVIAMFAELSSQRTRERPKPEGPALWSGETGIGKEPKISKGENYKGLPWVMLDYPRVFGKEDVYAIRIFFWWGHAFNVTLHLKGVYREKFLPVLLARQAELATAGFEWGSAGDEWAHEHTRETYGQSSFEGAADPRSASSVRKVGGIPGSNGGNGTSRNYDCGRN